MTSDYGDEAGEKLFDWMLRLGQEGGEAAMEAGARKLKDAIASIRGDLGGEGDGRSAGAPSEFARLDLSGLEALPEYASLREIIGKRLGDNAVEHGFVKIDGHDHLVFRVVDAPTVDEVFERLGEDVDRTFVRVREERGKSLTNERREPPRGDGKHPRSPDEEPLEEKALAAKEASKAIRVAGRDAREIGRIEARTR